MNGKTKEAKMSAEKFDIEESIRAVDAISTSNALDARAEICAFMEALAEMLADTLEEHLNSDGRTISEERKFGFSLGWFGELEDRVSSGLPQKPAFTVQEPITKAERDETWRWVWFCFGMVCQNYLRHVGFSRVWEHGVGDAWDTTGITVRYSEDGEEEASIGGASKEDYQSAIAAVREYALAFECFRRFFEDLAGMDAFGKISQALREELLKGF